MKTLKRVQFWKRTGTPRPIQQELATAKQELATAEQKLATAKQELVTAKQERNKLKGSPDSEELEEAQRAVKRAEQAVERAEQAVTTAQQAVTTAQRLVDACTNGTVAVGLSQSTGNAVLIVPLEYQLIDFLKLQRSSTAEARRVEQVCR